MLSCLYHGIFKIAYFKEHLQTAASIFCGTGIILTHFMQLISSAPTESIRKPLFLSFFQGVQKETSDMK